VADPPLSAAGELLSANRQRLAAPGPDFLGRSRADLSRDARWGLLAEAEDYLSRAGEPLPPAPPCPAGAAPAVVMAGHQPELFHPGVWVKNFALHGLARAHGAAAVNLIVDNDTVKSTSLKLPVKRPNPDPQTPPAVRVTLPFDMRAEETPYEERAVRDEALFASLAERVGDVTRNWGFRPLLAAFWPEVLRQARRTPLLGERFAAARRTFERRWGCHNLEVPVSRVCRTEPFAWFACHLLADLPRFHAVYNAGVQDYRRRYGIRSRHHPVPDLASEDGWYETPFWGWRSGQARRGRLLARPTAGGVELRAGNEAWPTLPPPATPRAIAAWQDLERCGFKVRSRALTNTLYARLFLTDVFMHGIGGGKYDELTDAILSRFYGLEPPRYMVLSATLLLPLPTFPARPEDCRRLAREARDLNYNPQRHLGDGQMADAAVRSLVAAKQDWVARQPADAPGRRERFQVLRDLTEKLRPFVDEQARDLRTREAECERRVQANEVLRRRDYAFCLYPEGRLRDFCSQFV
jgi:hypothetical protein